MNCVTIVGKSGKCQITIEGEWAADDVADEIASYGEIDMEGCDCIASRYLRAAEAKEAFVAILNAYRDLGLEASEQEPSSDQITL